MFKKNDPLVDSVKAVMEHNAKERQIEAAVNEEFGVTSKNALPHEVRVKYEQRLAEAKKCMYEAKPLSPRQKEVMDVNKNNKIDAHDLKLKRAGLEEKWHEESSKKKEELDEAKASAEQKAKVAKVMHHWKKGKQHIGKSERTVPVSEKGQKQAVAIGLKMAGLSKKKKMEEQAVFEEIRNNLEEQLVSVYESGDSEAFADFVSSLSEEQIEILELNEADGMSLGKPMDSGKSWASQAWDRVTAPFKSGPDYSKAAKTSAEIGSGGGSSPGSSPKGSFAGAEAEKAGATSTGIPKAPGTSSPTFSASERMSATSHMGTQATPSKSVASAPDFGSKNVGADVAAGRNQADMDAKAKARAAEYKSKGGFGGATGKGPSAGEKIASQVAAVRSGTTAPTATASVPKSSGSPAAPRSGATGSDGMTMAQRRAKYTPSVDTGLASAVARPFSEETNSQIKESFEHFLRNKFLKG